MTTENIRLQSLIDYNVLDTLPEKEFDDIVEVACAICNAPISLITLLDSHRQWFKAKIGFDKTETPIEQAFCFYAIQKPGEVMVVQDSWQDDRFTNNVLAHADKPVRFYAGAPLVTREGYALGTLCVIDNEPRQFTDEQQRILKILAERVMKQLELRRENILAVQRGDLAILNQKITLQRLLEAQRLAQIGSWDWNLDNNEFYWSPEMFRLCGFDPEVKTAITFDEWQAMVFNEDLPAVREAIISALKTGSSQTIQYRIQTLRGHTLWVQGSGKISNDVDGRNRHMVGTVLNITERKLAEEHKEQYTQALEEMLFAVSHKFRKPVANVFGLIHVLNAGPLTEDKVHEFVPYFKNFADELDGYIRELNGFLQQRQVRIKGKDIEV